MSRAEIADEKDGFRICISCFVSKPLTLEYHKNKSGRLGHRSTCRECRNERQYQRILELQLYKGAKHIKDCPCCGRLYCKSISSKVCRKCRLGTTREKDITLHQY